VLADCELNGIDTFLCLGDIVGSGPAPRDVLESVYQRATWIVAGERDRAVAGVHSLKDFDESAQSVLRWTRSQLSQEGRRFLADLPLVIDGPGFSCAHAEFELPHRFDYLANAATIWGSVEAADQPLLFVGHTRLPRVHEIRPNGSMKHHGTVDFIPRQGCRYLVDVGSVGDPRDGNPRASYCIFDTDTHAIQYRRIAFDVDSWEAEIQAAKLPLNPYVLGILKYGEGRAGELPTDFTPAPAVGNAPPVLDINQPRAYEAIEFDPALEQVEPEPKPAAKTARGTKKRRRSNAGKAASSKSKTAGKDLGVAESATAKKRPRRSSTVKSASSKSKAAVKESASVEPAAKKKKTIIIAGFAAALLLGGVVALSNGDKPAPRPPEKVVANPPVVKPKPKPKTQPVPSKPKPKPTPKPAVQPVPSPDTPPPHKVDPKKVVVPDKGLLHAKFAVVHGNGARYENRVDRYCIGHWNNPKTWVSWKAGPKKGRYKVGVVPARPGQKGPVEYEVSLADQILTGETEPTGDWGKFSTVEVGEIIVEKNGNYQVAFKLLATKGQSFLNLRGIQLDPVR
jgi:hypothetical protein